LQLSRALGHHSAAFTLSRYTHLLPGDEAPALDVSAIASAVREERGVLPERRSVGDACYLVGGGDQSSSA